MFWKPRIPAPGEYPLDRSLCAGLWRTALLKSLQGGLIHRPKSYAKRFAVR
jgi:hypothetical protein